MRARERSGPDERIEGVSVPETQERAAAGGALLGARVFLLLMGGISGVCALPLLLVRRLEEHHMWRALERGGGGRRNVRGTALGFDRVLAERGSVGSVHLEVATARDRLLEIEE